MKQYVSGMSHTGEQKRTLTEHTGDIEGLAFSPDGKTLVSSGSGDGTIRFWDVRTGDQTDMQSLDIRITFYSVAFNPDEKFFASGYEGGSYSILGCGHRTRT